MDNKKMPPFPWKPNMNWKATESPENESFGKLIDELSRLKDELGEEEFDYQMMELLGQLENYEEDEDDNEDDDFLDIDYVTKTEWSKTHPANLTCGSDAYYADLANEIAELFYFTKIPMVDVESMARETGRVLAAYLEDIVSGTHVFGALRRVCMQMYGYKLPFFDCEHDDYMLDHINIEDIQFLIWKTACLHGMPFSKVYSPVSPAVEMLAESFFDILNSRFEEAPEATRVADWLRRSLRKEDYICIREVASWLYFNNPLTYSHNAMANILDGVKEYNATEELEPNMVEQLTYTLLATEAWQRSMSPMGCTSMALVAAVAMECGLGQISKDIEETEVFPSQLYAIREDKKTHKIIFEKPNHETLEVRRDSFAKGFKPQQIQYGTASLIKFKGQHFLNGSICGQPGLKEKWENGDTYTNPEIERHYALQWIEALDGQQIVCAKNLATITKKLNIPQIEHDNLTDAANYVVLISADLGLSILPNAGYAFDLPGNRFFRKRQAAKESFSQFIASGAIPHDLAMYIQERHILPEARIGASQGKEVGHKVVQDYIAFWIGFYRRLPAYGIPPKAIPND